MPKYRIKGERTLVEAWTYIVEAEDVDEAIQKCEDCPDGSCEDEGVKRLQDDTVYEDDIEFSLLEEIKEPKNKAVPKKKVVPKKKKK